MKAKKFIKVIAFILIFSVCFFSVQALLSGDPDTRDYRKIKEFFSLEDNTLDAVFLGSSATYAFWTPAFAYGEYGITVYPLSTAKQEILAARYLIEDARKAHPDALYIVNLVSVTEQYNFRIHRVLDGYPNTLTKYKMIDYLTDLGDYDFEGKLEFYFPIVRFHSRWSELDVSDFRTEPERYMASNSYNSFLNNAVNVSGGLWDYDERIPVSERLEQGIHDLLDYCEEENVKVLFVLTPQSIKDEVKRGQQNTLMDIVKERGFDTLDMNKLVDEIGLDPKTDFYDRDHTNLHGSLKVTSYLSRYLIKNYGFEGRYGEEYSNWETATADYYKLVLDKLTEEDLKLLPSLR
jgi:hypothetical protein